MSRYLFITLVVLVLDQLSKIWITSHFELYEQRPIFSWLNMTFACNEGAAFSFLSEAGGWQRWLLAVFAAVVSAIILIWLLKLPRHKTWLAIALALILGGALGNLWDRIVIGCVVDFIQVFLSFIPLRLFNPWPSFNVADSAIFIGAVIYILDTLFEDKSRQTSAN